MREEEGDSFWADGCITGHLQAPYHRGQANGVGFLASAGPTRLALVPESLWVGDGNPAAVSGTRIA